MNYGNDIKLGGDRDILWGVTGDVERVSGAALIAQDIAEEASVPRGSVLWDREAGSDLLGFLNHPSGSEEAIMGELERLALKDPRVDASSVRAFRLGMGRFKLMFRPLAEPTHRALKFDLASLSGGSDE